MKAILVGVDYESMPYDLDVSIEELKELAKACFIEVKDVVIQRLSSISPKYYIGKGKVLELKDMLEEDDIVIFNEKLN